jgi:predicted AAA+ superfamily ATPase
MLKEIVSRFQVRNVSLLIDLNQYLANHLGSLVSAKKISDFLKSQNLNYSPRVIINYLTYLTSSFLIHKVRRANLQDRKIYEVNEKYYFEDLGLRHSIVRYKDTDIAKVLENLIYKHLIYCGYDVFVGQLGKKEIDFWCEKMGKSIYVQAVHLISDEKTHQREFGSLLEIKDNYPKYVVSMDPSAGESYEGIHHMHILDFLTSDV